MNQYCLHNELVFLNLGKEPSDKRIHNNNEVWKMTEANPNNLLISPTDQFEIPRIINKIKIKKVGVDGINNKMLNGMELIIAELVAHIIN